MMKTDTNK